MLTTIPAYPGACKAPLDAWPLVLLVLSDRSHEGGVTLDDGGVLGGAAQVACPNFDERPSGVAIGLLIVHAISLPPGEYHYRYVDALFCNRLSPQAHPFFQTIHHLRVSAHLLVERNGGLRQYVDFDKRAWHAGRSVYEGRRNCNDFSIGIELLGDGLSPYTDEQYEALAEVAYALMLRYPGIGRADVVGHQHVAVGRKTDPGRAFNWPRFRARLAEACYKGRTP